MLSMAPSASSQIRRSLEQVRYLTLREVVGLHEIDELSNRLTCSSGVLAASRLTLARLWIHYSDEPAPGASELDWGRQGEEQLRKEPRPAVGVPIHATAWRSLFGKGRAKLVIETCRDEIDVLVGAVRAEQPWEAYVAALHE